MLKILKHVWTAKTEPSLVHKRNRITLPGDRVTDIYAIGDVHGRLDLLLDAERRILEKAREAGRPALVVCLGDFVDRGPQSRGVLDHLLKKLPSPLFRVAVCGNHDDAFLSFLKKDRYDPAWLEFGGDRTLMSYGIDAAYLLKMDSSGRELKKVVRDTVPADHVNCLEQLPVAVTVGRYHFVHAGIVPGRPLEEQSDVDLMWIREPFLTKGPGLDMTVIHGHTPSTEFQYGPNRIGIDTGAYMTGRLGVLHIGPDGISEI